MTLTTYGKNAALGTSGFAGTGTHLGLLSTAAAVTAITGVTSTDIFTKTSHGFTNGDVVKITALTGGTGLVNGRIYYIIGVSGNNFQLSNIAGGSAVDLGTDVTAMSLVKYTEISGGSPAYARVTNSWNTPADGNVDNNAVGSDVNVPAAATVNAIGVYTASTSGNLLDVADVTAEGPYGAQGLYQVTDYDVNLNAAA
jgi:hypothetical protein